MDHSTQELLIMKLIGIDPYKYRKGKMKFSNPFRYDKKPGCYFDYKYDQNYILMCDWSHKEYHCLNVLDIACIKRNGHRIKTKDDLDKAKAYLSQEHTITDLPKRDYRKKYQIKVETERRNMEARDVIFWGKFGITEDNLTIDGVYPVSEYSMDYGENFVTYFTDDILAYAMPFKSGSVKIYKPGQPPDQKWDGFTTKDDVFLDLQDSGDRLFLLEGYKDARCVKNLGYNTRGLQSTTILPAVEKIREWANNYSEIVFLFDPDKSGVLEASKNVDYLRSIGINAIFAQYEFKYSKFSDVSDVREKFGEYELRKLMKNLKYYKKF